MIEEGIGDVVFFFTLPGWSVYVESEKYIKGIVK
jgi:hypothetical protein